ncbi:hypothetical protein B0H10DRAFT_1806149 [Mycena sp. CBHHK59/15]|nr:hypothetical protein B0H10DRAFT_1806149 [Mycena sp. CBHHK59/15]
MVATVRDLILILQLFFPSDLALPKAFYLLGVIISLYPLLRLHLNQQRQPRQPSRTAWSKSILALLVNAFKQDDDNVQSWASGLDRGQEFADYICRDLGPLYGMLGLNPDDLAAASPHSLFPAPRIILCTSRLSCIFCPVADLNIVPTLRRREIGQKVWLLDEKFHWAEADLLVAHCATCRADYYPDRITYRDPGGGRRQRLEFDPNYLRVSKNGIWVHHRISVAQEKALHRFHGGWSNFADWVNDCVEGERKLTYRQSQRLFMEHFSRRLLVYHQKDENFSCAANPNTHLLAKSVRELVGINGGVIPAGMKHGCTECTHVKRYQSDLLDEGAVLGNDVDVAGVTADMNDENNAGNIAAGDPGIPILQPQQQNAPPMGTPRGYVRMAVMDGKTIKHRKCALDECVRPLVNYKNGRFCDVHINLQDICGIIPCGLPVRHAGALTCATQSHIDWQRQYANRFSRLSFPGVRRVIRRQQELGEANHQLHGPTLQVQLAALGDTPGGEVVHTFKAKTIYCLQTVQWACGAPVGWGKCYRSESSPQVLGILNSIWADYPDLRPGFIAYDDACSLLRHIVTQNATDSWVSTTKFIVDAWHYIGHRATDILCRLWCNPAPVNGAQPDLVLVEEDENGEQHQTRAFNTEAAEQLNSWLTGFEPQLRQMSEVNYDFFIHILMMIYGENVADKVARKGMDLSDEFWVQAIGE